MTVGAGFEGLLYKRDFVALVGRRRHGKTTLACNLSMALALGSKYFLGYEIPCRRRVLAVLLEDDASELQDKLRTMAQGRDTQNLLHVYTRDDLLDRGVKVDAKETTF